MLRKVYLSYTPSVESFLIHLNPRITRSFRWNSRELRPLHGFLTPSGANPGRKHDKLENTVEFVRDSVNTYARSALPFVSDAHTLVQEKVVAAPDGSGVARFFGKYEGGELRVDDRIISIRID